MSVEVEGIDELISSLEQLGDVGKKAGKKAVNEGLKIFLEEMKRMHQLTRIILVVN